MRRVAVAVSIIAVVSAACGDTAEPAAGSTAILPPSSDGVTTAGATSEAELAPPPLGGLASIDILTPASGVGVRPLLEWSPIAGAAEYIATVSEPGSAAYWAWTGTETSVYLGGTASEPLPDRSGPYLHTPMELRVVALDGGNQVIAISEPALLTP